jgi:hypothetical protein
VRRVSSYDRTGGNADYDLHRFHPDRKGSEGVIIYGGYAGIHVVEFCGPARGRSEPRARGEREGNGDRKVAMLGIYRYPLPLRKMLEDMPKSG